VQSAIEAGGFVLVVGDSTAGKTRLAYEAMRACRPDHVCVQPETPEALLAATAAARRERPSVLWLDDLERYLGMGGLTRAAVVELTDLGVVVLATMRAHERDDLSARHDPHRGSTDRQAARSGREVLSVVDREVRLARLWSDREKARAAELADDVRIAQALAAEDRYGLAEIIAAGPQLLAEWKDAWSAAPRTPVAGRPHGDPRGAALVAAAVDIRRAGYHRPVPGSMLHELHDEYLRDMGGAALRPGPWQNALAWATQPLHATSSLLLPADDEHYLAFDYLVDAVAADAAAPAVPAGTWRALVEFADPVDLVEIIWQASFVGRVEDVPAAFRRALDSAQYRVAAEVAVCLGHAGRESQAAEMLATAIDRAAASGAVPAEELLSMRQQLAWEIGEKASGQGDPARALPLIRQVAADAAVVLGEDHPETVYAQINLARQLGATGDPRKALRLAEELVERATENFGPDHDATLSARFEVAVWTRELDGPAPAAALFRDLLAYVESGGPRHPGFISDYAWNLGGCLIDIGDAGAAVAILEAAVADSAEAYGTHHAQTFDVQLTHVRAVGHAGDPEEAARYAAHLVDDSSQALGEDHPITQQARIALAEWTTRAGRKLDGPSTSR